MLNTSMKLYRRFRPNGEDEPPDGMKGRPGIRGANGTVVVVIFSNGTVVSVILLVVTLVVLCAVSNAGVLTISLAVSTDVILIRLVSRSVE
jgi:hypothetical protein